MLTTAGLALGWSASVAETGEALLDWSHRFVDLPPEALNTNIVVEFRFITYFFESFDSFGWHIDEVSILGN